MIREEDIFQIGKIGKTHGIKGELSFSFTTDVFDKEDCDFFILERESIFVPFFIESYRISTVSTGFVKFENIENEIDAKEFSNAPIYLPKHYEKECEANVVGLHYFVGFEILDNSNEKSIGKITDIDEATANILFVLEEENLLIPASEEYITEINHEEKIIYMDIPEGLLEVQE